MCEVRGVPVLTQPRTAPCARGCIAPQPLYTGGAVPRQKSRLEYCLSTTASDLRTNHHHHRRLAATHQPRLPSSCFSSGACTSSFAWFGLGWAGIYTPCCPLRCTSLCHLCSLPLCPSAPPSPPHLRSGAPVLTALVAGAAAVAIEALSDRQVVAEVMAVLRNIFEKPHAGGGSGGGGADGGGGGRAPEKVPEPLQVGTALHTARPCPGLPKLGIAVA